MADNDKYTPQDDSKQAKTPKLQTDELETDELEDASGGDINGNCPCGGSGIE